MRLLADTIVNHILSEATGDNTYRYVLPSYPAALLWSIGTTLEERLAAAGRRSTLLYGVAPELVREWQRSSSATDKARLSQFEQRGWVSPGRTLTNLRNRLREQQHEDTLVTLMAGYDHISDRASLQDFYHLDDDTIWRVVLKGTFKSWVSACVGQWLDPADHAGAIERVADLLAAVYGQGLADLPGISHYLQELDLSAANTDSDVHELVLGRLEPFRLPPMRSLAHSKKRPSLAAYIGAAQEFANYGAFLEQTARDKALRTIKAFRENKPTEPDSSLLGPAFGNLDDLLDALSRYVGERSEPDRQRLLQADFAYVHDTVLDYRIKKERNPERKSVRRLRGLAPEVFLRALWLTLGDYCADSADGAGSRLDALRCLTLRSVLFTHDFDASGDSDETTAASQEARGFLARVLGGIDALLEQHLQELVPTRDDQPGVISQLAPADGDELRYHKSSVAEPTLRFEVRIDYDGGEIKREYLWCLPENHQARLLDVLMERMRQGYGSSGNALPVLAIDYLPEMFAARDENEVNRILGRALGRMPQFLDLLTAPGIEAHDPVLGDLGNLSAAYQRFLQAYEEQGFFAALEQRYDGLRLAYVSACLQMLKHSKISALLPLLVKAFFLADRTAAAKEQWKWQEHMPACIATPLHPAVLDMLRHQHAFLCESLLVYARDGLTELGRRHFTDRAWNAVADLARMERPVFGTLANTTPALDSTVRSFGYVHLVGQAPLPAGQASARLLLDYDADEDEEIADVELFRETRSSALICEVLQNYGKLHPYASDGLSIGAYCGSEVQPLVAGIDSYLEALLKGREERPYWLSVTVYTSARDDSSVTRWLDAWRQRWQEAELSSSMQHYGCCRISLAYRVVAGDRQQQLHQLARLLQNTPLDVLFFLDFAEDGASHFVEVDLGSAVSEGYRKFPVLEKAVCALSGGGRAEQRERVLSHRRFELASLHAEVMARAGRKSTPEASRHLVIRTADLAPWQAVLDSAHRGSAWVVCVDPLVDDHLLRKSAAPGTARRDIIGFGTGVGAHGQNNYTVSTEQSSLVDLKRRIARQLSSHLGVGQTEECERVAASLVAEASALPGLSVVKATGPSEYVRDYVAYATVRKLLPRAKDAFCDEVISLDAYSHWFTDAQTHQRPDLLRLQAWVADGHVSIAAQIIECKMAQRSDAVLAQARDQVRAGLLQLVPAFSPRPETRPIGIKDRPEQLYWWMQLHRLLASRGTTSTPRRQQILEALERLAEGLFTIAWQAAIVAVWTDAEGDALEKERAWPLDLEGGRLLVPVYVSGAKVVRRVALQSLTIDLFAGEEPLRRTSKPRQSAIRAGAGHARTEPSGTPTPPVAVALDQQDVQSATVPEERRATDELAAAAAAPSAARAGSGRDRLLLGRTLPGNREVYWEFGHEELPNRHILVFGASGTGKTYTIQALLCELGKLGHNAVIVDYTNGFTTNQLEEVVREGLRPKQHTVRREPLPINPFRQLYDIIDDQVLEESPTITAQRVAGLFSETYQLGDQQKAALYTVIRDGLMEEGSALTLESVMGRLGALSGTGGAAEGAAASLVSKLQPFVDMHPFGREDPESWEHLFTDRDSRCHIIQLAGFSRDMGRLITEFTLIDLYRYYRARGSKARPRVVVLDEIQNLDHKLQSPLGQLLTEGRKFGISLVLATQTLSSLDKDARDRLFQASHKLFFKPADTELRSFAQIMEQAIGDRADEWVKRLSSLARGECYSMGPARNDDGTLDMKRCVKLRIASLAERL
ncbi:MAG: ATP-binding protein [Anaerolineae bacterium]